MTPRPRAHRTRFAPPARPRARKRFGQHFLAQPETARRIVDLAELTASDSVLEIGPGRGALTDLLVARAGEIVLVEIDRDLAGELRERFAGQPRVRVFEANVLRVDLGELLGEAAPLRVVANLPYNISTPVLLRLLERPELFCRLVLMLQKEVALRLVAEPGSRQYGALSVLVQLLARLRIAFAVPPSAFVPRPKVDSAVVVLEPRDPPPLSESGRIAVRRVVRAAFSQRRKQLGNALSSVTPDAQRVLEGLGIDPRRRPATLSPADFVALARSITPRSFDA